MQVVKVISESVFYEVKLVQVISIKIIKSENPLFSYIVQVVKVIYKSSLYREKRGVKKPYREVLEKTYTTCTLQILMGGSP